VTEACNRVIDTTHTICVEHNTATRKCRNMLLWWVKIEPYGDWWVYALYIAFLGKNLTCLGTERLHFALLDYFTLVQLLNLPTSTRHNNKGIKKQKSLNASWTNDSCIYLVIITDVMFTWLLLLVVSECVAKYAVTVHSPFLPSWHSFISQVT